MNKTLQLALDRFDTCVTAESDNRDEAIEALKFRHGEQWPENIKRERDKEGRPCLTLNRVPQFVRHVINDIRQSRPAIKVRAVDSESDPETANIINGMIRAIEKSSNAEIAYDWAAEYAITGGWGYFRVTTDYSDPLSFEQDIKIERIQNPFSVYLDPERKEPDGSDARYCFVVETMQRKDFEKKYPKAKSGFEKKDVKGMSWEHWFADDTVQVAEYWVREEQSYEISLMPDESVVYGKVEGAVATRTTKLHRVKQYIISGQEILEERDWAGKYIPIIPVLGDELNIEGETKLRGMVTPMMDAQRQYNYWRTASTERIALSPKAPYIGVKGQFKSTKWRFANQKNYPYLEYDEVVADNGQLAPPPRREMPPDVSPGIANEINMSAMEFHAITGIQQDSLGIQGNVISEGAVLQRQRQSDNANFHFIDNLGRAIRHCGRILVDLIPKIYDTPRIISILKPGGEDEIVKVNEPYVDDKNKERFYDLKAGRYDVVVDIGPSYATQRQEAAEAMTELMKAFPESASIIGDLAAKNFDWPEADEVSRRLKLLLPPEILANDNPQLQAILRQKDAEMGQMQEVLQYLQQQLNEKDLQLQSKEREDAIKAEELRRKRDEMNLKHAREMTELELEYTTNVPGAVV